MEMAETSRLSSIDEWGDRKKIIPASVQGIWRTRRTRVQMVLLIIFLVVPWTKINGLQTLWLDIPARRFTAFGRVFLAHEAPLIFLILGICVLGLALFTALWGRIWCGWACPQTVFIDALYRRIEEWTEGNYIKRRRLKSAPMSPEKFVRKALKWAAYVFVSSVIAHSFIAYFAGASRLWEMSHGPPLENWGYFLLVTIITGTLAFNFGWFREQFCVIMCPYGRFQSVLMDEHTVTVGYDNARGEPRRSARIPNQKSGDCISCNRCVEVCPTAIDIRNGTQMECIGCTACIDACNEMMTRIKKPPNLIGYKSQSPSTQKWMRPRVLVNSVLLIVFSLCLVAALIVRDEFYVSILRAKDLPYQVLPTTEVTNHFKLHLHNQSLSKQHFEISIPPAFQGQGVRLTQAESTFDLVQAQDKEIHFFVTFPKKFLSERGEAEIQLHIGESKSGTAKELPLKLVGPIF